MTAYDTGFVEQTHVERVAKHASWTKAGPVVSRLPEDQIAVWEERAVTTVGDPSPLGLWGFATGTWMVATAMGGILPSSALVGTAPVLLIFAGIAQFIAGLWAYRRANALAATAFCCFGAFNVTVAMTLLFQSATLLGTDAASNSLLLGFLLVSFGFIALSLTVAAVRANMALVIVLGTLCVGYTLSGIPHLTGLATTTPGLIGDLGAYFLMASAFFAYYAGAAMVVNSTWGRSVLPLGGEP